LNAALVALAAHVEAFNAGVAGDGFDAMLASLTDGCVITFIGVPVGPFKGRAAIAESYAANPPDDEIVVLDAKFAPGQVTATYAWTHAPDRPAGRLTLELDGELISAITVDYWTD
jgi:steroid delta-isomerase